MNTIMSPNEADFWEEALSFYDERVFKETGQPIILIRDVLNWKSSFESRLDLLRNKFHYLVTETRHVDFSKMFDDGIDVLCPAGKEYFRVWNDGSIEGCPYVGVLSNCGNAKERTFIPRENLFRCNHPRYCDCSHIKRLGKMRVCNSGLLENV